MHVKEDTSLTGQRYDVEVKCTPMGQGFSSSGFESYISC
jgi:hypothetical protein